MPAKSALSRRLFSLAAPAALLALSACATPFRADVARFQRMPAPQGQTFYVQAADPRKQGGLEFNQYASYVTQELVQQGYRPAENSRAATLVVNVDYGVDGGREKIRTTPGFGGGFGYGGWGGPGFGYGRFGYGRFGSPFMYGWNDPWLYGGGWGPEINSYTYFTSHLDVTISRAADGERLFEGKAKARSTTDSLPALVPNLVAAMFTDFPGRSGEDVRITIPPPARAERGEEPRVEPRRDRRGS